MNTCPLLIHKTEGTTIADITNTITSNIIKINLINPLKLAVFFFANEAEVVVFVNLVIVVGLIVVFVVDVVEVELQPFKKSCTLINIILSRHSEIFFL